MGRAAGTPTLRKARNILKLRRAARRRGEAGEELGEVIEDLSEELGETLSKTEGAQVIGISVPTLDKWAARGLIPVKRAKSGRPRIPRDAVLLLAEQVEELRSVGQDRHLIAAVVDRLQHEDGQYQQEFRELYGPALAGLAKGDYVSAVPGPVFGPED